MIRFLRILPVAVIALSVAIGSSSCRDKGRKGGASEGPVLAKVNGKVITPEDYAISLNMLYPADQRAFYTSPVGKQQFLQQLVTMELFYQEGVAQGIEQDPKFKAMVENYKRYIVFTTLMGRGITASAIEDFFRNNFVHVAIIYLKKPEKVNEKEVEMLKAKAQKIREEIANGADFADMAKKYSELPSAKDGGDLGAIARTRQWEPEMLDAAYALTQENNLSEVVESPTGFYIIRQVVPLGKTELSLLTPVIRRAIYAQLLNQNFSLYAAQLQTQAQVETNPQYLDSIKIENVKGPEGAEIQDLIPEGIPGMDPKAVQQR